MEYKRLGDYIEPVDERNSKLEIKLSQGISNEKYFQNPRQVAENSAADKIVRRGYFAYNRATTRNGEKISIAYREGPDCTVSSAYQVFRIKDEEKLNPKYLLMWYKRPDFDRYARFKSHGSAHEFFEYDEMCDVYLPLPDIDRQREIVEEYETLSRRIRLNEQMIEKLEATAQALYRKMFVDGIDKENLPEGWRMGTLGEIANCYDFKRRPLSEDERKSMKGFYPYYGAMSVVDHINQYIFDGTFLLFSEDGANVIDEYGHPALQYLWGKFWVNNHAHVLQGNEIVSTEYLYMALKGVNATHLVTGAAQPKINQENMNSIPLVIPSAEEMTKYNEFMKPIFSYYKLATEENSKLSELQSLLLAKMGNLKQ